MLFRSISPEKSQEAVMDLSKMLRYVLYDDGQQYVPIQKEIDFINNYVKLMRLRLSSYVRVDVTTDVSLDPTMPIAPLLFISLIENAFKHGISNNSRHSSNSPSRKPMRTPYDVSCGTAISRSPPNTTRAVRASAWRTRKGGWNSYTRIRTSSNMVWRVMYITHY